MQAVRIVFKVDKKGKPLAYRESRHFGIRLIRISYEEAMVLLATGKAISGSYAPAA